MNLGKFEFIMGRKSIRSWRGLIVYECHFSFIYKAPEDGLLNLDLGEKHPHEKEKLQRAFFLLVLFPL